MVWRLGENTILLIIYVGEGLCKNLRHVCIYYTYFESTNGNVTVWPIVPVMHEQPQSNIQPLVVYAKIQ